MFFYLQKIAPDLCFTSTPEYSINYDHMFLAVLALDGRTSTHLFFHTRFPKPPVGQSLSHARFPKPPVAISLKFEAAVQIESKGYQHGSLGT